MLIIRHRTGGKDIALPLSSIASARGITGGWIVTDLRGEEHEIDDTSWDIALQNTPTGTVPALPGTYVVELCDERDGTTSVLTTTILGWAIFADGVIRPMVLDSEGLYGRTWFVRMPDGRVESSQDGGQQWESVALWKQEQDLARSSKAA